jgi:hypothetical protein
VRFAITEQTTGKRLRRLLPPNYRGRVPAAVRDEVSYSLILFPHDAEDVIRSSLVRKALARLVTLAPGGLVAVGANFTEEARQELARRGAVVVALGDFYWTDASYDGVTQT